MMKISPGMCEFCPRMKDVIDKIGRILDNNLIDTVTYKQWTNTDRYPKYSYYIINRSCILNLAYYTTSFFDISLIYQSARKSSMKHFLSNIWKVFIYVFSFIFLKDRCTESTFISITQYFNRLFSLEINSLGYFYL